MSKIKLCKRCQEKFKAKGGKGGKLASHADKVRAGKLGAEARRLKKLAQPEMRP